MECRLAHSSGLAASTFRALNAGVLASASLPGAGDGSQGFIHSRQALYPLSHSPAPHPSRVCPSKHVHLFDDMEKKEKEKKEK